MLKNATSQSKAICDFLSFFSKSTKNIFFMRCRRARSIKKSSQWTRRIYCTIQCPNCLDGCFSLNICWGSPFLLAVTVSIVIAGFPLFGSPRDFHCYYYFFCCWPLPRIHFWSWAVFGKPILTTQRYFGLLYIYVKTIYNIGTEILLSCCFDKNSASVLTTLGFIKWKSIFFHARSF